MKRPVFFILVLILIVEGALSLSTSKFLPTISFVLFHTFDLLNEGLFIEVVFSLKRLFIGVGIALVSSYFCIYLSQINQYLDNGMRFLLSLFYPIPKIALFPLFMLFFGIGERSQIALISFGSFFLIFYSIYYGVEEIKKNSLFSVVEVYNIQGFKLFWNVYVKGTVIHSLSGLNLGLGYSLVMVVASEMYGSTNGIGNFIWNSWDAYRINDLYSGIFLISLLGLIFNGICNGLKIQYSKRRF